MSSPAVLPRRELAFPRGHVIDPGLEWLTTNGLGGYASGPVRGGLTRRFHGLLIAALPAPTGRLMCLNLLRISVDDGTATTCLEHEELDTLGTGIAYPCAFTLEGGVPIWRYEVRDWMLEKRVVMPYRQNTTHVLFRLVRSHGPVEIRLRPMLQVRPHEGLLTADAPAADVALVDPGDAEVRVPGRDVTMRWRLRSVDPPSYSTKPIDAIAEYPIEHARGYDHRGPLSSPGAFSIVLSPGHEASFTVSTETWDVLQSAAPGEALATEMARRRALLEAAGRPAGLAAELTLAADQFIVTPVGRSGELSRARALGEDPKSVIAGYHWFTDWGRDTMISLEGLALTTGRARDAAWILRTFAHYVRDGLIPNMFPEGEHLGLYHTADASLWFFHAVHRYVRLTGDDAILTGLRPALQDIAEHHVRGTRFGIGIDERDGLLRQGADGYQLTWMDAKVGDWVVTPRRGKAVEINALWYNALCLLRDWERQAGHEPEAVRWEEHAARVRTSFNKRFWNPATGYLFDVIDGSAGDDPSCRPNQLFAIALDHPVLDPAHWREVVAVVTRELLTPVGLRTLSPKHPDYRRTYDGDLFARDAAYHQGTVWPWLIGPFVDAWRRACPEEGARLPEMLGAFSAELNKAGIGTLAEIFDAESPFHARGCIAQAWSVAELLRVWTIIQQDESAAPTPSLVRTWPHDDSRSR